ncbi:cytochrome B [Pedobacter sp. SYSU D00535]|uniref:cytochrome B n=1 Tax=Pedobacter sp. SYSU D00535 TaxID=2810308 RepID=UPI001A96D4A6|nr:cytochrome B [Pedobacter sp. SYSU D00535]
MYPALLEIHSITRFVILIAIVVAILLAFAGWFGNKEYSKGNKIFNLLTLISTHIQIVIGIILYFVSPLVMTNDMGAAMKDELARYWTVEHGVMMIIAAVLITVGYSKHKKATSSLIKHRTIAIFFTLGLLTVLAGILLSGRPLLATTV